MRLTRRGWRGPAIAAVLLGVGVLAAQPVYLFGAIGILSLVVGRQLQFVLALRTLTSGLTIAQDLDRERVLVDDDLPITAQASLAEPVGLAVDIDLRTPLPATHTGVDTLTLDDTDATGASSLEFSVAGTYTIPAPRVTVRDPRSWFTHTYVAGNTHDITVEPRRPRNLHVGQGGEQFVSAYGDHPSDAEGTGMDPAELREYTPGDPASRIDWRATARLNEAFVREFDAETDRRMYLILDTRTPLADGPEGETKLDYLRQVALAYLERSREDRDPIGYAVVGEDGIRDRSIPDSGAGHYASVRQAFFDTHITSGHSTQRPGRSPVTARANADRLTTDDSDYATRLRPFFEQAGVDRIREDPLFAAVQTAVQTTEGTVWTVILTDDTHQAELTEAITLARRGDRQARVLLTPSVLFSPGGLSDLDTAYDQYVEFEEWRRDLDDLARVRAFEVGPGDRLDAILARARTTAERGHP